MNKKVIRSLCAAVLALCMAFSLVACTGNSDDGNTTTTTTTTTTGTGDNSTASTTVTTTPSADPSGSSSSSSSSSGTSASSSSSSSTSLVSNSTTTTTTPTTKPNTGDTRTYYMKDATGNSDRKKFRSLINQVRQENLVAEDQGKTVNFVIAFEKKAYSFDDTIVFLQNDNLTIEGNGCRWIFTDLVQAVNATNCENLTIKNVSVDYDPLPFTQGVVTGYSGGKMLVKIDAGYRTDASFLSGTIYASVHDPNTGGVKAGSNVHYTFSSCVQVDSKTIGLPTDGQPIAVGEQVSVFQRGTGAMSFKICKNTVLQDVNLWSGPGFGITGGSGYGNLQMIRTNVEPGPIPQGGTKRRMRSVNADGTHFSNDEVGPTLDSCKITHCGDDGINVQAFYYHILEVKDSRTIIACPKYDNDMLNIGATLEFCEKDSYDYVGEAKIVTFEKRYDKSYADEKSTAWAWSYHWQNEGDCIYEIKLDRDVNLKAFDHFTPMDRLSVGTTIKNCTFGWNTARGIVVKCPDAVIENNHIEGCTNDGLMALPDLMWAESHFAVNLVVRGNTFKNNCLAANAYNSGNVDNIGALVVGVVPTYHVSGFMDTYGNKNILIENNTITDSQNYGIVVTNADGVTVRNNKIVNPFYNGSGNVKKVYQVTPNSGILIGKCKNITVMKNIVTAPNKAVTQAVDVRECSGGSNVSTNSFLR